jgi:uncharacterized protein with GYD domain
MGQTIRLERSVPTAKECHMPTYMTLFEYTKAAWHEMVQRPEDREAATRQVMEANGGRLVAYYWMFGDHDGFAIYEAPDSVAAAAVLVGITATGRIEKMATCALLTGEEAVRVLELAKSASTDYAPPGGPREWFSDFESHG